MIRRGMFVLLMMLHILVTTTAVGLSIAHNPVSLSLRSRREKDLDTNTKPYFFEKVLGLHPGQPFTIDRMKWNSLRDSRLFSNLTGRSTLKDDKVTLHISGVELTSVKISPKINVEANLMNPRVSGGVKVLNNNFRGMGELFEFSGSVMPNEAVDVADVSSIKPDVSFRWADCAIGQPSRIGLGHSLRHSLQDSRHTIPVGLQSGTNIDGTESNVAPATITDSYVDLEGTFSTTTRGPRRSALSGARWGMRPYFNKMASVAAGSEWRTAMVGVKSRVSAVLESGCALSLVHDAGHTVHSSSPQQQLPYSQVKMSCSLPAVRRPVRVPNPMHRLRLPASTGARAAKWLTTCDLVGSMALNAMMSSGPGRVPHHHLQATPPIRGYSPGRNDSAVAAYAVLNSDLFLDSRSNWGQAGVFADTGVHQGVAAQPGQEAPVTTTVGLSYRNFGVRVDVASPLAGITTQRPVVSVSMDSAD